MYCQIFLIFFSFLLFFFSSLIAQNGQSLIKEGAPNVYLDCYCDRNFIKEQIPVVNYVRDRKDADVHILFHNNELVLVESILDTVLESGR